MANRQLKQRTIRGCLGVAVWGVMIAVAWRSCGFARAQETPRLRFSDQPAATKDFKSDLVLRPNLEQRFFIYVQNPTNAAKKVFVELRANGAGLPGAKTDVLTVKPGEIQQVAFKPAPAPAAPAPAAPAPAGGAAPTPPPGIELKGPPFDFQVNLNDAAGPSLQTAEIKRILLPQEYVKVGAADFKPEPANPDKNLLTVEVEVIPDFFFGPPCVVDLVLPPDRIPGLVGKVKEGVLRQKLSLARKKLPLSAVNLKTARQTSYFYLTVDDYQRAFVFETNFRGGSIQPLGIRGMRLYAQAVTQPKEKFPVRIEVDDPVGDKEVAVQLGLDRDGNGVIDKDEIVELPPGPREQHVRLNPAGPDGAVVFTTSVQDWTVELDTTALLGKHAIEASLVDRKTGDKLELLNSRGERVKTINYVEYLDAKGEKAKVITFDDSAPEDVQFVNVPKRAIRSTLLAVTATGIDPETEIREASFFFGKPIERKPAPNAELIDAALTRDKSGVWTATAELALPDKKGPLDISVRFVNGAGLPEFATTRVFLTDPPGSAGANKASAPGKVKGKVLLGDLAQGGVTVALAEDKKDGKVKTLKSKKEDGTFLFEDVEPGKYKVSSSKPDSGAGTKDEQSVTVESGKTAEVTLKLMRTKAVAR